MVRVSIVRGLLLWATVRSEIHICTACLPAKNGARTDETPQSLKKSNILPRAKSSPCRKSAACIICIDEPPKLGADGPAIIRLGSIEGGLLQRSSRASVQTGH